MASLLADKISSTWALFSNVGDFFGTVRVHGMNFVAEYVVADSEGGIQRSRVVGIVEVIDVPGGFCPESSQPLRAQAAEKVSEFVLLSDGEGGESGLLKGCRICEIQNS